MTISSEKKSPILLKIKASELSVPQNFDKTREISLGCKVDPRFSHMMQVIYENSKSQANWDTISDFYRAAVWFGINYIKDVVKNDRVTNEIAHVNALLNQMRTAEQEALILKVTSGLKRRIEELKQQGDVEQAKVELRQALEHVEAIDPKTYIGRKLRRDFQEEFGPLIKKLRISHRPSDAEEDDDE